MDDTEEDGDAPVRHMRTGADLPLIEEEPPAESGARILRRKRRYRRHRVLRVKSARRAIEPWAPDMDYEITTGGEFSLLDVVLAVMRRTGPAHLTVVAWTVGLYDSEVVKYKMDAGEILSATFVVDVTMKNGGGSAYYAPEFMETFGEERIRTTRVHAKFVTITNEHHKISISSTANLNENQRMELFYFSHDPARADWYDEVVAELFRTVPPGWNKDTGPPDVSNLDPAGTHIEMGTVTNLGRVSEVGQLSLDERK